MRKKHKYHNSIIQEPGGEGGGWGLRSQEKHPEKMRTKEEGKQNKLYNEEKNTTCKDPIGGKSMMFSIN